MRTKLRAELIEWKRKKEERKKKNYEEDRRKIEEIRS